MANQETVVVNHVEGEQQVQLSFTYAEPALKFERVFNLNRSSQEPVGVLTARIASNVERFLSKKARRLKKKQSTEEVPDESLAQPEAELLLDGLPAQPEMTCHQALVTHAPRAQLRIGRQRYQLSVNPPAVAALRLPLHVMAGFPVYPSRLELAHARRADSRLLWEREVAAGGADWQSVGEGACYLATPADVGRRLRLVCQPADGERRGQPACVTTDPVQAGPGPCPFEKRHVFTTPLADRNSYRVISYNILADLYADSDFTRTVLHPYCPPYALHIDYRKQLVVKELLGYNGDIVCLQEVDKKVFDGDLTPRLGDAGLEGVFTDKGGQVTEGLVCFFRRDKLRLLQTERLVLAEALSQDPLYADIERACAASPPLRDRLTKRTQALQVNVLESTVAPSDGPPRLLVVANTHLYFKPDADHVRALQIGMCMRHLERLVERLRDEVPSREVALLFCGDFNSCPEFSVVRLMTTQSLEEGLADFSSAPGEEVRGVSFRQPYQMASACGMPAYTNHVDAFVGCLDYIFYMADRMEVLQVVPLPSHEEVTRHTALPSVVFPSDHLALVADLGWRRP